jgi:hypothetical protein
MSFPNGILSEAKLQRSAQVREARLSISDYFSIAWNRLKYLKAWPYASQFVGTLSLNMTMLL